MNAKIVGECGPVQLHKRCYLPGVVLVAECPKCHNESTLDFEGDYLSYPTLGEPARVGFTCEICDTDWEESVVLSMSVKVEGAEC